MFKRILFAALIIASLAFTVWEPQSDLELKFYNAVETTYDTKDYQLEEIFVSEKINAKLPAKTGSQNLFQITSQGKTIGYAYLGTAPSKKEQFEYVVLFDADLVIKKSKVLIYREDYGLQIGTQRWLKQFIGLSPSSKVKYGENIAAISGATISATSMTRAVDNVLKTVAILQKEQIL